MKKYYIQSSSASKKSHSTEHAITQLVDDQISESFENDNYKLQVLLDLSSAFDTVDHAILLKKLKN